MKKFIKNGTKKEFEKLVYDLSKISFGMALIAPLIRREGISSYTIIGISVGILLGTYLINKGTNNE